jgi:hypothetical protein
MELERAPRYQPFENGWSQTMVATADFFAGRMDRYEEVSTAMAAQTGFARVNGLCNLTNMLAATRRGPEARAIADEMLAAARAAGNPAIIGYALWCYGRAFADTDPVLAMRTYHDGLAHTRLHRLPAWEMTIAQELAQLEMTQGSVEQGLIRLDSTIGSFHQSGQIGLLTAGLASLAVFLARNEQPEVAATLYGATTPHGVNVITSGLTDAVEDSRVMLGDSRFAECVAAGEAMELAQAVQYAHHQIQLTLGQLDDQP